MLRSLCYAFIAAVSLKDKIFGAARYKNIADLFKRFSFYGAVALCSCRHRTDISKYRYVFSIL